MLTYLVKEFCKVLDLTIGYGIDKSKVQIATCIYLQTKTLLTQLLNGHNKKGAANLRKKTKQSNYIFCTDLLAKNHKAH